jgi:hypothetical protein
MPSTWRNIDSKYWGGCVFNCMVLFSGSGATSVHVSSTSFRSSLHMMHGLGPCLDCIRLLVFVLEKDLMDR